MKTLPNNSLIFCTHEYTQLNMAFCKEHFPDRDYSMIERWIDKRREMNLPTIPTTIEREKAYNPFLLVENLQEFVNLRQSRNDYQKGFFT